MSLKLCHYVSEKKTAQKNSIKTYEIKPNQIKTMANHVSENLH